jgi:hypothetical protein
MNEGLAAAVIHRVWNSQSDLVIKLHFCNASGKHPGQGGWFTEKVLLSFPSLTVNSRHTQKSKSTLVVQSRESIRSAVDPN